MEEEFGAMVKVPGLMRGCPPPLLAVEDIYF